jgi:putative transposase
MPRRAIPFLPDLYYHFYNRGNNRQQVFFERDNYLYFLHGIKKYLLPYVEILVYSLMPTHYHILGRVKPQPLPQTSEFPKKQTSEVAQPPPQTSEFSENSEVSAEISAAAVSHAVSQAMMRQSVSYTKAINKRFSRVGALFQGQFQSKPIQHYHHLINLCVYIHANPVKDGLVTLPEEWEFSNYLEWMNYRAGTLVDREFVNENFGTPEEYKILLQEYLRTSTMPEDVRKYLQDLED